MESTNLKSAILIAFVFASCSNTNAQITTVVQGMTCGASTCSATYNSPGTLISPQDPNQTVSYSGISQVEYSALHEIQLLPGFSASGYSGTGFFAAKMDNSGYDITASQTDNIPEFEKVEYAIKVPDGPIGLYIDNFLNNVSHPRLNPFNPDELNVEATFTSPTGITRIIYGFFSKDYVYNGAPSDPATRWSLLNNAGYNFRVRFAPDELGTWNCSIKMKYPTLIGQDYTFGNITFHCVASSNKGYIMTGNNGYLKFSKTNETFFPLGAYMGWANFRNMYEPSVYDPSAEPHGRAVRPCEYDDYMQLLINIKEHGGNYARLIITPQSWGIEWEKLGNYYDRLPHAWELDRIIQWAEENDFYLNIAMMHSVTLMDLDFTSSVVDNWQGTWEDNPYKTIPTLVHPDDPTEFITNSDAKTQYKKYLRYFAARYAYSTHIAKLELANETNQVGTLLAGSNGDCLSYHPYSRNNYTPTCTTPLSVPSYFQFQPLPYPQTNWPPDANGRSLAQELEIWHGEMAGYLKVNLGVKQLISTSYAGDIDANDHTFLNPNIATTTEHSYKNDFNTNLLRFPVARHFKSFYNGKPFMFEEQSFSPSTAYNISDRSPASPDFHNYVDVHNEMWSQAFMGVFGVTPTIWPGLSTRYQTQRTRDIAADNMPALADFFSGVDLNAFNYVAMTIPAVSDQDGDGSLLSGNNTIDNTPLEAFILHAGTQAMGWVHMRRWYWATADGSNDAATWQSSSYSDFLSYGDECNFKTGESGGISTYQTYHPLDPLQGASPANISGQFLRIPMTDGYYTVDWYETGSQQNPPASINLWAVGGTLTLLVPDLKPPADLCIDCRQDLAFKIRPASDYFHSMTRTNDTILSFGITPNPGTGFYTISERQPVTNAVIEIFDLLGKSVFKKQYNDLDKGQIDISHLNPGVYYVKISNANGLNESHKIIKQ